MKKLVYNIAVLAVCLAFHGCGMTDVWKEWEDQGNMSEDRLLPSEVKSVLCSVGTWKMTYEGTDFYFQFTEDGSVTSDSDETILQSGIETDYYLDYDGEDIVLLTIDGGGLMAYLDENSEETLAITSYSTTQIVATGQDNGVEMILTPTTTTEIEEANEDKRLAIIAYNKAQSLELLKTTLSNGIFRNSSTESFVAHYQISCDDSDNWSVKISYIEDNAVTHTEYAMTLDTSGDESAVLSITDGADANGSTVNAIYYGYDSGDVSTDNASLTIDLNKSSDMADMYTNSWTTHIVDRDNIYSDFADLQTQVEFDDRSPRNIIVCPGSINDNYWHYVGFTVSASSDDTTGCMYLENTAINYILGNYGDDAGLVRSIANYAAFLEFCFSEDGLWWYEDSDSYMYVISPNSSEWFRMAI